MSRLWEKGLPLAERTLQFTAGRDYLLDARLVHYDVVGSIAHAQMLHSQGHLGGNDTEVICAGLRTLATDHENGGWQIRLEDEDAHTALESRLCEAIGEVGEKLHLGRSRNDQVLTALRLYMRDVVEDVTGRVSNLQGTCESLVRKQGSLVIPGYTHMQHAMPSTVALWCGGFQEGFADAEAGLATALNRVNKNPLGSAAGFGTPGLPLNRDVTTETLGFCQHSGTGYGRSVVARQGGKHIVV